MPTAIPVSTDVDTFMQSANQADMQSAIGVGPINTPKVYYVETTGNNATAEVGNPAKPYQTAQAAYDAGVAAAVAFVIKLGVGQFVISTGGIPASVYLESVIGCGFDANDPESSATKLEISTDIMSAQNANGAPGAQNPLLYASNIYLGYYASGQDVNCNDGIGGYTAGDGGTIHVIGNSLWNLIARGGNFQQNNGESGAGGLALSITVEGGIIYTIYCQNGSGYSAGEIPPSISGNVTLRHVDAARDNTAWGSASQANVTAGCSSLPVAVAPVNDKGGNAAW